MKYIRGDTKGKAAHNSKGVQKFQMDDKFSKAILSWITEITKAYIWFNNRQFIWGEEQQTAFEELEMCGLAINIASFFHLLKRVDFDAIVDHLVLTHIIKSKAEPATTRTKMIVRTLRFIFIQFILYKRKGNDSHPFLSRQKHDNSNPNEIIPISFNMQNLLHVRYYKRWE